MACEFFNPNKNSLGISCERARALGQLWNEMQGVFGKKELMLEICRNSKIEAREQCPAYIDIVIEKNGRNSSWVRYSTN